MMIAFTDMELIFLTDDFEIMEGCPKDIRESLEEKLQDMKNIREEMYGLSKEVKRALKDKE